MSPGIRQARPVPAVPDVWVRDTATSRWHISAATQLRAAAEDGGRAGQRGGERAL